MFVECHFRFYKMLGQRFGRLPTPQVERLLGMLQTSSLVADEKSIERRKFGVVDCGILETNIIFGNFVEEYIRETLSFDEKKHETLSEIRGYEKYAFVVLLDEGVLLIQYRKIPGSSWDSVQKHLKQLIDWFIARLEWGIVPYRYSQGMLGATRAEVLEAFSQYEILEVRADGFDVQAIDQSRVTASGLDPLDALQEPLSTEMVLSLRDLENVTARAKKDANLGTNPLAKALVHTARSPRITYKVGNEHIQVCAGDEDCLDFDLVTTPDDGDPELQALAKMALHHYHSASPFIRWDRDEALTPHVLTTNTDP